MRLWKKLICIAAVLAVTVPALLLLTEGRTSCCLCDSLRYHAPCLIDLETGELVELALYFPDEAKTGELAAEQPETNTFSLLRLGGATGFRQTGDRTIQIDIPCNDTASASALCRDCLQLLEGYGGRYILADLYSKESRRLLPITDGGETALRCYRITMTMDETKNSIRITVQGTQRGNLKLMTLP